MRALGVLIFVGLPLLTACGTCGRGGPTTCELDEAPALGDYLSTTDCDQVEGPCIEPVEVTITADEVIVRYEDLDGALFETRWDLP